MLLPRDITSECHENFSDGIRLNQRIFLSLSLSRPRDPRRLLCISLGRSGPRIVASVIKADRRPTSTDGDRGFSYSVFRDESVCMYVCTLRKTVCAPNTRRNYRTICTTVTTVSTLDENIRRFFNFGHASVSFSWLDVSKNASSFAQRLAKKEGFHLISRQTEMNFF